MVFGDIDVGKAGAAGERVPPDPLYRVRNVDQHQVAAGHESGITDFRDGIRQGDVHQRIPALEGFRPDGGDRNAVQLGGDKEIFSVPFVTGDHGSPVRLQTVGIVTALQIRLVFRRGGKKTQKYQNQCQQYGRDPLHSCVTSLFLSLYHIAFFPMRQMIFRWKSLKKCDILPLLRRLQS